MTSPPAPVLFPEVDAADTAIYAPQASEAVFRALEAHPNDVAFREKCEHELSALWAAPSLGFEDPRFTLHGGDPKAFSSARWAHIAARAAGAKRAYLRAHFYDLLWEYKSVHGFVSPFRFLKGAVESYLESRLEARTLRVPGLAMKRQLGRAADLAMRARQAEDVARVVTVALDEAELFLQMARGASVLLTIEGIVPALKISTIGAASLRRLTTILGALTAEPQPDGQQLVRRALDALIYSHSLSGLGPQPELLADRARSFTIEGRGWEDRGEHARASHFYEMALRDAIALGDQNWAATLKLAVRRSNQASVKDFGVYTVDTPIDRSATDRFAQQALSLPTWRERLQHCADELPLPDQADISAAVEKLQSSPDSSIMRDIPKKVIGPDGRFLGTAAGEEEKRELEIAHETVARFQTQCLPAWLTFLARAADQGLTGVEFARVLLGSSIVAPEHSSLVEYGVDRFLSGDQIGAAHVLVPQLEASIRNRLAAAGVDTTAVRGDRMTERTLGAFWEESLATEVARVLGSNTATLLRILLVDESGGFNLRNRVAHGLAATDAFTRPMAETVLLGFVLLLSSR